MAEIGRPDGPGSYSECMEEGMRAAESGRKTAARRHFSRAAQLEPGKKDAWLWLAGLAADPREAVLYLEKARDIDPSDPAVREGMQWAARRMAQRQPAPTAPQVLAAKPATALAKAPPRVVRPWAWALAAFAVVCIVSLILFGPSAYEWAAASLRPTATPTPTNLDRIAQWREPLEEAWQRGDWMVVITILERVRSLEPGYGGVNDWLTAGYTNYGRSLVTQERWDQAGKAFQTALEVVPGYPPAQTQVQALSQYLSGLDRADAGDWKGARAAFQSAYALDSAYPNLPNLLYDACYRHGLLLQGAGDLRGAKTAYEDALEIVADGAQARAKLAEVNYLLTPPTPTPTPIPPKKIVVDISEQRMYVYEGNVLIYKWVCSSGEPGRDTRTGTFFVQSKIAEAWSSVWRLRMPYWLGIYWAGASENGIHALPINANGTTLWAGYLGSKVSFGCIILDTPNARTLFNWAEIGTPVVIKP